MHKQTTKTWSGGGLGSTGIMVGHDDLKGLSLPKQFHNSMTLFCKNL